MTLHPTSIVLQAERESLSVYYENHDVPLPIAADGGYAYAGFGIWPNTSTIAQAFGDWSADSLVARILAEDGIEPYWTLLINPLEDDRGTDQSFGGVLTIGELVNLSQIFNISSDDLKNNGVPDLTQIANYPVLNNKGVVDEVSYYILVDSISWGNSSATLKSSVPGTPDGKISAYLDSTDPWIYAPYSITEELYKNLEGATYAKDTGLWHVKCTELTISFTIAGKVYPISPLTALGHIEGYDCVGNVSRIRSPVPDALAYGSSGSSEPSQTMLMVILSLVFPSVRPLRFGVDSLGADNHHSEERLRSLCLRDQARRRGV